MVTRLYKKKFVVTWLLLSDTPLLIDALTIFTIVEIFDSFGIDKKSLFVIPVNILLKILKSVILTKLDDANTSLEYDFN